MGSLLPCCGFSTTCLDEKEPLLRLPDSDGLMSRGLGSGKYSYLILSACPLGRYIELIFLSQGGITGHWLGRG